MAKPHRLPEIEKEYGEKLTTLIPRKLNELGNVQAVAVALGVSVSALGQWCSRNKVQRRFVYFIEDERNAQAS